MLHGEPSWSYLYRKMIPIVTAAGLRADRAGPHRLRAQRQAGPAGRLHVPGARRLDCGVPRSSSICGDHARLPGLGRADRPASRGGASGALRAHRRANTFLPTGRQPARRGVPALAGVLAEGAVAADRQHREGRLQDGRAAGGRGGVRRAVPRRHVQGRRAQVSRARADAPGRSGVGGEPQGVGGAAASGRSRSSARSATKTRSRAAAIARSRSACPARRGSRTRRSWAAATSCRKTRARSWRRWSWTSSRDCREEDDR